MKKNIGYINLYSSMAKWLVEHVPASELKEGIEALIKQELSSLVVEADTKDDVFSGSSVISYGALTINERFHKRINNICSKISNNKWNYKKQN